jgi:hypothetical protein
VPLFEFLESERGLFILEKLLLRVLFINLDDVWELLFVPFINEIFKVVGKFFRFEGKVDANLLNEGLES